MQNLHIIQDQFPLGPQKNRCHPVLTSILRACQPTPLLTLPFASASASSSTRQGWLDSRFRLNTLPFASSASSDDDVFTSGTGSPDPEKEAQLREEAMASLVFPDKMDHKEIVVSASSESATGQERKDEWQFTFDRVRLQTVF